MPRHAQKASKSKKKKTKKSTLRGLPRAFIQEYGKPVTFTMISKAAWDQFYKDPDGQTRARKIAEDYETEALRYDELGTSGGPKPSGVGRTEAQIKTLISTNAAARAAAKSGAGVTKPQKVVTG
jgi:hypothetical protein